MSDTLRDVSAAIEEIVHAGGTVLGSKVAEAIKSRFGTFQVADYQVASLREFVKQYVPGVAVVGRSGMDVVYGRAENGAPSSPAAGAFVDPDFWRIWISPNSPHSISVNRESGAIQPVSRGATFEPPLFVVEPPGTMDHRNVAREFLTQIPEELRSRLTAIADSPDSRWWQDWLQALHGSNQLGNWYGFRRQKFAGLLRERLSILGLPNAIVDQAIGRIEETHAATSRATGRSARTVRLPRDSATDESVRRLVTLAVQRMSASELRDLRLPLGVILDTIDASKSR